MNSDPLVSIIMPSYNHSKYIDFSVSSILAQTYHNWELFVIDDGSEDDTVTRIENQVDKRIKLLNFPHEGLRSLSVRYNKALSLAKGEFIAIIDGDDGWPETKLTEQLELFRDENIVLTWGKSSIINKKGDFLDSKVIAPCPYNSKNTPLHGTQTLRELLFHNLVAPSSAMIRSKPLFAIGGFQQPIGCPFVDYTTWLPLLRIGNGFATDQVLGYWRHHEMQTTQTQSLSVRNYSMLAAINTYFSLSYEDQERLQITSYELLRHRMYHLAETHWAIALKEFRSGNHSISRQRINDVLTLGHRSLQVKAIILSILIFMNRFNLKNKVSG